MPTHEADHGVGTAAKEVADHTRTWLGLEVELAKLELKRKLAALGVGIGLALTAAVLALFALGFLLAAAAAALALAVPTWAALLVVAGALVLLVGALALAGVRKIARGAPPVPEQAIEEARLTGEAIRSDGNR